MSDSPDPSIAELLASRPHLTMHAMDGLVLEDTPLHAIADALGTPTWVYGAGAIRSRYDAMSSALRQTGLDIHVHYAIKANDHLAILRLLATQGAGADIVSGGELLRARQAGIPPDRIVFSGVGKTEQELRLALEEGIAQINVESAEELRMLSAIAHDMGRRVRVALRVNPSVDADTHTKISTGRAHDKFGIPAADAVALYREAAALPGIEPVGIAAHIGSQIRTLTPYRALFAKLGGVVRNLRQAGLPLELVDCGGGLAVPYRNEPVPSPTGLAGALREAFHNLDVRLLIEPGRWLVAQAGVLLCSVILVKNSGPSRFVVLDAAMNDLMRPAMYDAWHGFVPVSAADAVQPPVPADIVGPVCESSDTFARNRLLPLFKPGSRVAILDAGAYGSVMSSTYNARPLAAAAMVDGGRWSVIRPRQDISALWRDEAIPEWLA